MSYILLILVLHVLAVARVTRFLTTDRLTDRLREALIMRFGNDSLFAYLWFCRWCMSIWVAFATAPAVIYFTNLTWWLTPFIALAASHATGLLARAEPSE